MISDRFQFSIVTRAAQLACVVFCVVFLGRMALGQETPPKATLPDAPAPETQPKPTQPKPTQPEATNPEATKPDEDAEPPKEPLHADPAGLKRIAKDYDVWIDLERKLVVIDGKVCLRQGPLEMFACPRGTKEHEAVVALNSPARFVHAGLLAVGAKQGSPVRFRPEYTPATGTVIDVWVLWKDAEGMNRKVRAQEWIRNVETEKALEYDWVFGGSGFWTDEETGERHYHADGGDLICVSNFSTAMMDLPVESSQTEGALLFDAFTERIPPIGTQIRLVLAPRIDRKPPASGGSSADPPAAPTPAPPAPAPAPPQP